MSKMLAELLGISGPFFDIGLKRLELGSGQASVDVRLTAEIIQKIHQKLRELGLDAKDTTADELYFALLNLVEKHDGFLAKRIGVADSADVQAVLSKIHVFVQDLDIPRTAWVLKQSSARRLLKATPPKKLMKQLGYRSLDSMIKREPVAELFSGLRFVESNAWMQSFIRKYKALSPADFEVRKIECISLNARKWGNASEAYVRSSHHNVTYLKELGVVTILPLPVSKMRGLSITLLPLLLHYIHEIRVYSTYFKLQQVKPDFGDILAETLLTDPGKHASIAGHDIHWRIIHEHFGSERKESVPEFFEPHIQMEDLFWRKAEDILYHIEPALHFWHGMDYVAAQTDELPVSFNLSDLAASYMNNLPYGQQSVHHVRQNLWNELYIRYLRQPGLEAQVLKQLDNHEQDDSFSTFAYEGVAA